MIFNELCLIHANTTSDEGDRRTSHDIALDDESRSKYGCVFMSHHGSAEMLHLSFAFNVCYWYCAYIELVFSSDYLVYTKI